MAKTPSPSLSQRPRKPSPAIVAQEAVRRLPRVPLLLLCAVYVLAGFIGREPWKSADIAGFGLLFNWLGTSDWAWFIARCGAAGLLALTLLTTWYSTYYLARRDAAQPVPFAFGGEAKPTDYARAIADGALLALMACLGLAQLSHETTPALLQLALVSLLFFALSCYRYHPIKSSIAITLSLTSLALLARNLHFDVASILRLAPWQQAFHLLLWFAWPAWALALLTLIRWHRHWLCLRPSSHIVIPLAFVVIHLLLLFIAQQPDRWFLSALPALSTLAAFALPTLKRSMKSLIDLFTLLFFTGCAFVIWIVWLAMQTGIPPQPATNVARLAPLFTPTLSLIALALALFGTAVWIWLMAWRLGKHRPAIWMSMVLPASGAVLCWTLLMTLWLPLLDHARSYKPLVLNIQRILAPSAPNACLQTHGITTAQAAALRYYLDRPLVEANRGAACDWLVTDGDSVQSLPEYVHTNDWEQVAKLRRPTDDNEDWLIFQRKARPQP